MDGSKSSSRMSSESGLTPGEQRILALLEGWEPRLERLERSLEGVEQRLQALETGQQRLEQGQQRLEQRVQTLEQGQQRLEQGQQRLEQRVQGLEQRAQGLERGQQRLENKVVSLGENLHLLTQQVGREAAASKQRDRQLAESLERLREEVHGRDGQLTDVWFKHLQALRAEVSERLDQHNTRLEMLEHAVQRLGEQLTSVIQRVWAPLPTA